MNAALFPDLVVNGETVPHALIAAEAQNHQAPKGKPGIAWRKAAKAVAVRTLLLQEARSRGLLAEPEEVGPGRFETEEEALIRGLLDQVVDFESPKEEKIHERWERDPSCFRSPPLWEVSHILIACDPRDEETRSLALAKAIDLTGQAHGNPKSFAELAVTHSDCGSRASGGALGQLVPGDTVPEFEAALREMSEGEISAEPVLTRHGYHIIRMDGVSPGSVLPYESVRQKILDAMEKASWTREAHAFVAGLVERSEISGADMNSI